MVGFSEIIGSKDNEECMLRKGSIDRNGRFYHATQRVSNKEFIFDKELGQYRHNMLCRICSQRNIKIIFSVTMSNHTHDVLVAEKWRDIVDALRLVNTAVSHRVRKRSPTKYRNGRTVFESSPHYRVIKDIVELTTVASTTTTTSEAYWTRANLFPTTVSGSWKGVSSANHTTKISILFYLA